MSIELNFVKIGNRCGQLSIFYDTEEELVGVQEAMPEGFTDQIPTLMIKKQ